ncbi:MAG: nucleoside deaminase [Desulfobacteraceae bacterium]|nr:nucleoside deaminase [Desulfobacteraceae bacterium]
MDLRETDEKFMRAALKEAGAALEAGEFPVGCVIAGPSGVVAAGERRCSKGQKANEIDHAEITAIKALYDSGFLENPGQLTLYSTMEPCLMCFGAILIAGIRRIVYGYEDVMGGGTKCSLKNLPSLYRDAEIKIVPYVLRDECMELFYRFFSNPPNTYLQGTLLAEYTLCLK